MSYVATLGRTLLALPMGLFRSRQAKVSLVAGAVMGLTVGANARAAGQKPAPVFEEVRNRMFTADGRLAERATTQYPTPMHEAAADALGPWATESIVTFPESWNAATEQVVIVPMIRALLGLAEAAAGVGYWLGGFIPPQVIGYGGLALVGVLVIAHLRALKEVFG